MEELLSVQNISKFYGRDGGMKKALDDVSFTIMKQEFVGIMGSSGSGKSTLLHCISTLNEVTSGKILYRKEDISLQGEKEIAQLRKNNFGFIFQDYNLIEALTLRENISLALTVRKLPFHLVNPMIDSIAKKLNIAGVLDKFPYEVSDGQRQCCACARALIGNPKLLLADEPTGAMDSHSAQALLQSFCDLNQSMDIAVLLATNDAKTASYCERVLFLKDGRILSELHKEAKSRSEFLQEILDHLFLLGKEKEYDYGL